MNQRSTTGPSRAKEMNNQNLHMNERSTTGPSRAKEMNNQNLHMNERMLGERRLEESVYGSTTDLRRSQKNPVFSALKNLIVAIEIKSQEDRRFQEKVVSNREMQEYITREQVTFLVNELRTEKSDREVKARQISLLRNEVNDLRRELISVKSVLKKILANYSVPSKSNSPEMKGMSVESVDKNGGSIGFNAREENHGNDSLNVVPMLRDHGYKRDRGGGRPRRYESGILAAFEMPPGDFPETRGSIGRKACDMSSCDSPSVVEGKRKFSGADNSLEGGLQKKIRSDSESDDVSESQQLKKLTRTAAHPLLTSKVVSLVLQFVGKSHYLFVGGVNKLWRSLYELEIDKGKHETYAIISLASVSSLNYSYSCGLNLKSGRFKGNGTGSPLSLSWWAGHIAPYNTIIRFSELRNGDPINICGGAASAGRLNILQVLLEKLKWRCDNGSICINAAEAPKPNVLQWLFNNGFGKWDSSSIACMKASAALFNRHRNSDFLSLVSKFRRQYREKKNEKRTIAEPVGVSTESSPVFGAMNSSSVNCHAAKIPHPVSAESPPCDTMTRLHTTEMKGSNRDSDATHLKQEDRMLEIAKATMGYIDRHYDATNDFARSSKEEKGLKVNQPGDSSDRGRYTSVPEVVDLGMASGTGAERSAETSIDKALAALSPSKSPKVQPVIGDLKQQRIETASSGSSSALKGGTSLILAKLAHAMPTGEDTSSRRSSSINTDDELQVNIPL